MTTGQITTKEIDNDEYIQGIEKILKNPNATTYTYDGKTGAMTVSNSGGDPKPWYGNFTGPGPAKNPYHLKDENGKTLRPIDMIDAAAQRHDYAYYKPHTGGNSSALFNTTVANADISFRFSASDHKNRQMVVGAFHIDQRGIIHIGWILLISHKMPAGSY